MKLLLHWLRWDLRRFRWPLLAWTALVVAFSVWLWHLNAHLLTVDIRLLKYNGVIAAVLGIFELFLLLTILSSDPAAGTSPFWKTRPPLGFAIAGARLIIALSFFIALPLLGWWTVVRACDSAIPPFLNVRLFFTPNTWMEFLWWMQSLTVSSLLLTTAAARGAGNAVVRVLAAFGVLLLIFFAAALVARERETTAGGWINHAATNMWSGSTTMTAAGLWLALASVIYLAARRTRTPSCAFHRTHLVVPFAMLAGSAWLAQPHPKSGNANEPAMPSELASVLRVGEPLLRGGASGGNQETFQRDGSRRTVPSVSMRLHISGLPPDCHAMARWKSLTLTTPDGYSRTMQYGGGLSWSSIIDLHPADILNIGAIPLDKPEDTAFSLAPCRAEGILKVELRGKHRAVVPVRAGEIMETTHARILLAEITPAFDASDQPRLEIRAMLEDFNAFPGLFLWLENQADPDKRIRLDVNRSSSGVGWFILHAWSRQGASPGSGTSPLMRPRLARDLEAGKLDDWQLGMSWYESEGFTDVPVALEQVIMPRQPGDTRDLAALYDPLRIPPGAGKEEVRRMVRYALGLMNVGGTGTTTYPLETDPLVQAVSRFLTKVPREHLDVLLRIAEELPPEIPDQPSLLDFALRRRIMELHTPNDIPGLRQRPNLLRYLCYELLERNLIPNNEVHGREMNALLDAELRQRWERSIRATLLSTTALQHAVRRGLPWVPAAVAEVVEVKPWAGETIALAKILSPLSDCPADSKAAIPWLQQNAARLKWDTTSQRWVLSPP